MNPAGRFAVIVPAAGKSTRFGGATKKAFLLLDGLPVWAHSATLFSERADVRQLILVIAAEDRDDFRTHFAREVDRLGVTIAPGGSERFESVGNALALVADDVEYIAVHDAARPCLTRDLIERVFARAQVTGAAMLAVPVTDTVKRAGPAGFVESTVPRQDLWLAQTPQVFRRDWLADACARRQREGWSGFTDDAQLVEAAGHAVELVPGSASNLKITTPDDLLLAAAILRQRNSLR